MSIPPVKAGDRIDFFGRLGTVLEIDTSAQDTEIGRITGWPYAAVVQFDDRIPGQQTLVNAFECSKIP